jgi:hypothetical protein
MLANESHMVSMNWITRSGTAPEHKRFKAMEEFVFAPKKISMATIMSFFFYRKSEKYSHYVKYYHTIWAHMFADGICRSKETMEQNWNHPPRRPAKHFKTPYDSRFSCEDGDDEHRQDSTHTIQNCID